MMDELSLAQTFEDLKGNPAFRAILAYLHGEVERSKGIALTALPSENDREVRNKVIAWQEREKVVIGIESMIDEQAEIKRRIEEEIENERAIERDRSTRTGW